MNFSIHGLYSPRILVWLIVLLCPASMPQARAEICLDYEESIPNPALGNPLAVVTSPDGKHVYVSSINAPYSSPTDYKGALFAFARDLITGKLTPLPGIQYDGVSGVDGIGTPTSIAFSPDGEYLYVASGIDIYGRITGGYNAVAVFKRDDTTGALSFVEAKFNGDGDVVGLLNANSVTVSPDGRHVYVTSGRNIKAGGSSNSDNAITVFQRDSTTGRLTFIEAKFHFIGQADGLNDMQDVQVSPDGKHIYTAGLGGVAVFNRDATTGALSPKEVKESLFGFGSHTSLTISPDGANIYVTAIPEPSFGSIFVFSRDITDGTLTLIETFREDVDHIGIGGAMDATITPDGTGVYVAAYNGDSLGGVPFFSRDAEMQGKLNFKGKISQLGTGVPLTNTTSIAMSPDGNNVYAVALNANSVVQFNTKPIIDSGSGQASCDGTLASPFMPCDRLANTWAFCPIVVIHGIVTPGETSRAPWVDPPYAVGYDYATVPGTNTPNFKAVTLLNIGDGYFDFISSTLR